MASDPQNFGLGELGQRVQAMSDPVAEPRLRPYQGGTPPANPPRNEPPAVPSAATSSVPYATSWTAGYPSAPATPEAYPGPGSQTASTNGYSHPGSATPAGTSPHPGTAPADPVAQFPAFPAPEDPNAPKSGLQRAINAIRSTLPLVQRLLPLLEGNIATAITALMVPQPGHHTPPPPAQVHVNLEPVERGLAEVRTSHRELQGQVLEQSTTLKRVEDQLERVREATDRNTLEQQELVEDLRTVGSRISTFAIIGLLLLALSLGLNIYFLVQLQHILR
jgi:hypothetical protein